LQIILRTVTEEGSIEVNGLVMPDYIANLLLVIFTQTCTKKKKEY